MVSLRLGIDSRGAASGAQVYKSSVEAAAKAARTASLANRQFEVGLGLVARGLTALKAPLQGALAGFASFALLSRSIGALTAYEASLAKIRKSTGLTAEETEALGAELQELSTGAVPTATQALLAAAEAAGAVGVRGSQNLREWAEAAARMGAVSDVAADQAARSIGKLIAVTGDQVEKGRLLMSTTVRLADEFVTSESAVLGLAEEVGQAGRQFGLSAEAALALGAALNQAGAESVGARSAIFAVFSGLEEALKTGSDKLDVFLQVMGTTREQLAATFSGAPEQALLQFIQGLGRLQAQGQNVSGALRLLGLENDRLEITLLPLAKDTAQLERALSTMKDEMASGADLARKSADAFDTLGGAVERTRNSIDVALIRGFGTGNSVIRQTIDFIGDLVGVLAGSEEALNRVSSAVLAFAAALEFAAKAALVFAGLSLVKFLMSSYAAWLFNAQATRIATAALLEYSTGATVAIGATSALALAARGLLSVLLGPLGIALAVASIWSLASAAEAVEETELDLEARQWADALNEAGAAAGGLADQLDAVAAAKARMGSVGGLQIDPINLPAVLAAGNPALKLQSPPSFYKPPAPASGPSADFTERLTAANVIKAFNRDLEDQIALLRADRAEFEALGGASLKLGREHEVLNAIQEQTKKLREELKDETAELSKEERDQIRASVEGHLDEAEALNTARRAWQAYDDAVQGAVEGRRDYQRSLQDTLNAQHDEAATFGMTAEAAERYTLNQQLLRQEMDASLGASREQVLAMQATRAQIIANLDALQDQRRIQSAANDMAASWGQAFEDVVFDAKNAAEHIVDMFESIGRRVFRLIFIEPVEQDLAAAISSALGGAAGKGALGSSLESGAEAAHTLSLESDTAQLISHTAALAADAAALGAHAGSATGTAAAGFSTAFLSASGSGVTEGAIFAPTYFPNAAGNQDLVVGEGGSPELIFKAVNMPGGGLGVKGVGGGGTTINQFNSYRVYGASDPEGWRRAKRQNLADDRRRLQSTGGIM